MPNFGKTTIRNRIHLLKTFFDEAEEIVVGYQVYNLAKLQNNSITFGDFNDDITYLVGDKIELLANESITFKAPNFVIDGNLNVKGTTTLDKTLNVTGNTTLKSNLNVLGGTALGSTLNVTGITTLGSTLNVTGNTTLKSNLNVTKDTVLSGFLYFGTVDEDGNPKIDDPDHFASIIALDLSICAHGDLNLTGIDNVIIRGDTTIGEISNRSDLTVNGDVNLYGNTVIGKSSSKSNLTVNGALITISYGTADPGTSTPGYGIPGAIYFKLV